MTSDRYKDERKWERASAKERLRHDSSECVEEKLKREKKIKKKKMRKNYTERADLLAYREVRIYIKEKEKETSK